MKFFAAALCAPHILWGGVLLEEWPAAAETLQRNRMQIGLGIIQWGGAIKTPRLAALGSSALFCLFDDRSAIGADQFACKLRNECTQLPLPAPPPKVPFATAAADTVGKYAAAAPSDSAAIDYVTRA